jgi:hypothetical protein
MPGYQVVQKMVVSTSIEMVSIARVMEEKGMDSYPPNPKGNGGDKWKRRDGLLVIFNTAVA